MTPGSVDRRRSNATAQHDSQATTREGEAVSPRAGESGRIETSEETEGEAGTTEM